MRGWVYVMTNQAMPGLVKVGASGKDPFERAKELRGTHNPHDFVVEYDVLVEDPFSLESAAHQLLSHVRVVGDGQGIEFFRCSVDEATIAIRALTKQNHLFEVFHKDNRDAVLAAEQKELSRIETERLSRERALEEERAAAEQLRQEESDRIAFENKKAEHLKLVAERHSEIKRKRIEWFEDQQRHVRSMFLNPLTVTNTLRMLEEGTFAMCTSCNRPNMWPYKTPEKIIRYNCGNRIDLCDG